MAKKNPIASSGRKMTKPVVTGTAVVQADGNTDWWRLSLVDQLMMQQAMVVIEDNFVNRRECD